MRSRALTRLCAAGLLLGILTPAATAAGGESPRHAPQIFEGSAVSGPAWEAFIGIRTPLGVAECSGAVLGDRWVVTAAHCISITDGPQAGSLLPGLTTTIAPGPVNVDPVRAFLSGTSARPSIPASTDGSAYGVPANYQPTTSQSGDLALIRLDSPADPAIGIPMARANQADLAAAGTTATARGWGLTESGSVSASPLEATGEIFSNAACGVVRSDAPFTFSGDDMLCAGRPEPLRALACSGDSGGPLAITAPAGYPLLVGVDSFGSVFCGQGQSFFTRTSAFADFVRERVVNDPVAPVAEPTLGEVTVIRTGATTAEIRGSMNPGGLASAVVAIPGFAGSSAPGVGSTLVGGGREATTFIIPIAGLEPNTEHPYDLAIENLTGPHPGPPGTIPADPGAAAGALPLPANTAALPVCTPQATASRRADRLGVRMKLSARQLRINQRIGQAALRRLNAIDTWLDDGIVSSDLCGGAFGRESLSGIDLSFGGAAERPAPQPRKLAVAKPAKARSKVTLTRPQLRINQRIYQAAVRRATALADRLDGSLTGGDVRDGSLGVNVLTPGASARRGPATSAPQPASRTQIAKAKGRPGAIRLTATQLRTNQRIAQTAVRRANTLSESIERGLTRSNFAPNSITAADFTPESLTG